MIRKILGPLAVVLTFAIAYDNATAGLPVDSAPAVSQESPSPFTHGLPKELEGTSMDGSFEVDAHGDLIVSSDVLLAYDYVWAASRSQNERALYNHFVAWLNNKLPPRAAQTAISLFDQYVQYRQTPSETNDDNSDVAVEREIIALHQLRRNLFGTEVANQLFASAEIPEKRALWLLRHASETGNTTPGPGPEPMPPSATLDDDSGSIHILSANPNPKSPSDAYTIQRVHMNPTLNEAGLVLVAEPTSDPIMAESVSEMIKKRNAWEERVQDYRAKRRVLNRYGRKQASKDLDTLRTNLFSGAELTRIQALDRIDGLDEH